MFSPSCAFLELKTIVVGIVACTAESSKTFFGAFPKNSWDIYEIYMKIYKYFVRIVPKFSYGLEDWITELLLQEKLGEKSEKHFLDWEHSDSWFSWFRVACQENLIRVSLSVESFRVFELFVCQWGKCEQQLEIRNFFMEFSGNRILDSGGWIFYFTSWWVLRMIYLAP